MGKIEGVALCFNILVLYLQETVETMSQIDRQTAQQTQLLEAVMAGI